jgi:Transcriptional regulators
MKLDKNGPLTLTYQVTEALRDQIISDYKPGEKIPAEVELVEEFDVSVITIKKALEILVNEGLIYRRRGKGTFVAEKKISSESSKLTSATELFKKSGHCSSIVVLECQIEKTGVYRAKLLGCNEDDQVIRLSRLRSLDSEAYSYEVNYLPLGFFPSLQNSYKSGSLYTFMEEKYNLVPSKSEEVYKAILLDNHTAKLLNQKKGDAAMHMIGKVFDQYGRVISIEESIYRSDKFELKVFADSNISREQHLIESGETKRSKI